MRKVSLVIAALALVLGTSQCKKEENNVLNGEKQHIVLNASFGDSNAKIDQNGAGLKWSEGDIINVMQGTEKLGELECKDPENGTFEGDITTTEGDITFTFGTENFMEQSGLLNEAISLTSDAVEYKADGVYGKVNMTMPHAVLLLDLHELGTAEGTVVTISNDVSGKVATVKGVKNTPDNPYYVALPAAERTVYTFRSSVASKTMEDGWPLVASSFYTEDGGAVKIDDVTLNYLCFTAVNETASVSIWFAEELTWKSLEYFLSSDPDAGWQQYTGTIDLNPGDKVYFRGDNPEGLNNESTSSYFSLGGVVAASGNIMSLISKDCSATEIPCPYCFASLFNYSAITTAPELPAMKLAPYCYSEMFNGCPLLSKAPVLPALELAEYCYKDMFNMCDALEEVPALPAMKLAPHCCENMFHECYSLEEAPALSAMELAPYCCKDMFYRCEALEKAPALPAMELAPYCYENMFSYCCSLEEAPALPATTLVEGCYMDMFQGCTSLNTITMLATDISADCCLEDWVEGIYPEGTFWKASSMSAERLKATAKWEELNLWKFEDYVAPR